jgi:ketosteroid isomerase-like protein
MASRRTGRSRAAVAVLLLIAVVGGTLTLAACGGSGETAASAPSATPTPSVAVSPEHLVGSDSVTQTRRTVEAYTAASNAGCARQGALYASDVVFHCYATGVHVEGREAMVALLRDVRSVTTGTRALAAHAGRGWAVLEFRQDFDEGSIQLLQLLKTGDGKIRRLQNYYQPLENQVGRLRVAKPLPSPPGPADTAAAARAVALNYAAALQAKDAAAISAMAASDNDFRDTASEGSFSAGELQHYTTIFKAPTDLAFTHLRYLFGRGWAAVVWTASASGSGGSGVTMLEIRDGKIRRETLYYNSSAVPFSATREAE